MLRGLFRPLLFLTLVVLALYFCTVLATAVSVFPAKAAPVGTSPADIYFDPSASASASDDTPEISIQKAYYETPLVGSTEAVADVVGGPADTISQALPSDFTGFTGVSANASPAATVPAPKLDATTPEQLQSIIERIHSDPAASQEDTRPIYAPSDVVDRAYIEWNRGGLNEVSDSHKACQSAIGYAIFSTPRGCMAKLKSTQPTKHLGYKRVSLTRRAPEDPVCLSTTVRCVDPSALFLTPDAVIAGVYCELNRFSPDDGGPGVASMYGADMAMANAPTLPPPSPSSPDAPYALKTPAPYWFQYRVYASVAVANAAWRQFHSAFATKSPDVQAALADPNVNVCRSLPDNADSSIGSLFARFPESEACANGSTTNSWGMACRSVNVECV